MTISSLAEAMQAEVRPHEKLLLIYFSESIDEFGHFRREFLPDACRWAGLTDLQFEKALLGLRQTGWSEDGVDAEGHPTLRFRRLSDVELRPDAFPLTKKERGLPHVA